MTAALLQGVPVTTFDIDLWIDLSPRQYIRMLNLCVRLGAKVLSNTVLVFDEEIRVNFLYALTGLRSFAYEYRLARRMSWFGHRVAVLPLERIHKSKSAIRRPKDVVHLFYLEQAMGLKRHLKGKRQK